MNAKSIKQSLAQQNYRLKIELSSRIIIMLKEKILGINVRIEL